MMSAAGYLRGRDPAKNERHLGEKDHQTEDSELGPVKHDEPDEHDDRVVATGVLDRQGQELAAVGTQRHTDDQPGARGDDREQNRHKYGRTEIRERGSSEPVEQENDGRKLSKGQSGCDHRLLMAGF